MKINFKYNLEMEWDNLKGGLNSKNHPGVLPPLAQDMADDNLDYNNKKIVIDFVKKKILSLKINPNDEISKIRKNWEKIETEAVKRMNALFGQSLNYNITVYLTINFRCSYNIDQHYFFVNMLSQSTNHIILHELLHFYTYQSILPIFKENRLDYDQFNDFKEALTFLLNTDFDDSLDGKKDEGYDKQKDLRIYLEKNWPKFRNVVDFSKFVIKGYFNESRNCRTNSSKNN